MKDLSMCMLLCFIVSPSDDHGDTWGVRCHITPTNGEGYVFISIVWFVCVSVSIITEKRICGLS